MHLAGLERKKIEDELAELLKIIAKLEAILADEKKILKIIKDELLEMLRNNLVMIVEQKLFHKNLGKMSDEDLVPDEQVVVTLTSANYIKRSPIDDYQTSKQRW